MIMLYNSVIQDKSRIFLLHEDMHILLLRNYHVRMSLLHVNKWQSAKR
jgi:hypothetical protein